MNPNHDSVDDFHGDRFDKNLDSYPDYSGEPLFLTHCVAFTQTVLDNLHDANGRPLRDLAIEVCRLMDISAGSDAEMLRGLYG